MDVLMDWYFYTQFPTRPRSPQKLGLMVGSMILACVLFLEYNRTIYTIGVCVSSIFLRHGEAYTEGSLEARAGLYMF